jgi:integrase
MHLTDTAIRKAKPAANIVKVSDGGGLQLHIHPNGSKYWKLAYRYAEKQKKLSLGVYPEVPLIEARKRRDAARALLAEGTDPMVHKHIEKATRAIAARNTFGAIADEFIEKMKREGRAEVTLKKKIWLFDLARPMLGERPISQISAAEVLIVLQKVERRGCLETARRLRGAIGAVFRYAISTLRAENDPTFALRGALSPPKVKPRAAMTEPEGVGALLRSVWSYGGQPSTKAALQLMAYLFPRPGELRLAEWAEFDLEKAVWSIPAQRMKMRRPHKVPLSTQAVAILRQLQKITGHGKLAFPSVLSPFRPISENTLNAALRRLGYSKDEATAHGFRATASTLLNESGKWHADAIERQLAHEDANAVRKVYARTEFWEERVRMMQWWTDELDALRDGGGHPLRAGGENVIPFRIG